MTIKNNTVKKDLGLLSEEGMHLLEVKKVLLSSSHNPLVQISFSNSLKKEDFEASVYEALFNENVNDEKFQGILLTVSKYTNKEVIKKKFEEYRKKLSNVLERKGLKHFSTGVRLSKGGVSVDKKIGINLDFIRREFLVTEKEAKKLQKSGFVETYANLKVNALVKQMIKTIEASTKAPSYVDFETTVFYHDEDTNYYNVDLIVNISLNETQLSSPVSSMNELSRYFEQIFAIIEKEYHKKVNG